MRVLTTSDLYYNLKNDTTKGMKLSNKYALIFLVFLKQFLPLCNDKYLPVKFNIKEVEVCD